MIVLSRWKQSASGMRECKRWRLTCLVGKRPIEIVATLSGHSRPYSNGSVLLLLVCASVSAGVYMCASAVMRRRFLITDWVADRFANSFVSPAITQCVEAVPNAHIAHHTSNRFKLICDFVHFWQQAIDCIIFRFKLSRPFSMVHVSTLMNNLFGFCTKSHNTTADWSVIE